LWHATGRRSRGEIKAADLVPYRSMDEEDLIHLLHSSEATKRTVAGMLLSHIPTERTVKELCSRLQSEKKLYTKIAISESLIALQEISCPYVLALLGTIGNNQESEIPQKGFLKISYPLPRDLAARTLCRFDTKFLQRFIEHAYQLESHIALEQLIDAIGHMIYTNRVHTAASEIIPLYEKHQTEMIKFKVIRCLSGIRDKEAEIFLYNSLITESGSMLFEVVRSVILSGIGLPSDTEAHMPPEYRAFATKLRKKL